MKSPSEALKGCTPVGWLLTESRPYLKSLQKKNCERHRGKPQSLPNHYKIMYKFSNLASLSNILFRIKGSWEESWSISHSLVRKPSLWASLLRQKTGRLFKTDFSQCQAKPRVFTWLSRTFKNCLRAVSRGDSKKRPTGRGDERARWTKQRMRLGFKVGFHPFFFFFFFFSFCRSPYSLPVTPSPPLSENPVLSGSVEKANKNINK